MVIIFGIFSGSFAALCVFLVSMMIMHVIISFTGTYSSSMRDLLNNNDKCTLFMNSSIPFMEVDTNMTILSPPGSLFTMGYVIFSMIANDNVNMLLIVMMGMLIINSIYHLAKDECLKGVNVFLMITSLLSSGVILIPIFALNQPELLLFSNGSSNNRQCGRVRGQKFKCRVFKNGQLIS
jgi:hypothetical protein